MRLRDIVNSSQSEGMNIDPAKGVVVEAINVQDIHDIKIIIV